jgi:hypothetical protein
VVGNYIITMREKDILRLQRENLGCQKRLTYVGYKTYNVSNA